MNEFFIGVILSALAILVFVLGWVTSASTIGRECKLLGSFYVSNTVYECKLKGVDK